MCAGKKKQKSSGTAGTRPTLDGLNLVLMELMIVTDHEERRPDIEAIRKRAAQMGNQFGEDLADVCDYALKVEEFIKLLNYSTARGTLPMAFMTEPHG